MGTTGKMVSCGDKHSKLGMQQVMALSTMARCEYITPLGLPVVPEV
jgi:hypothetical protein